MWAGGAPSLDPDSGPPPSPAPRARPTAALVLPKKRGKRMDTRGRGIRRRSAISVRRRPGRLPSVTGAIHPKGHRTGSRHPRPRPWERRPAPRARDPCTPAHPTDTHVPRYPTAQGRYPGGRYLGGSVPKGVGTQGGRYLRWWVDTGGCRPNRPPDAPAGLCQGVARRTLPNSRTCVSLYLPTDPSACYLHPDRQAVRSPAPCPYP